MGMPELEIYSMIGAEGFARLVAAFYRQVPQNVSALSGLPRKKKCGGAQVVWSGQFR
jgi:hypothetical protein